MSTRPTPALRAQLSTAVAALTAIGRDALAGSDELLQHYPEVGEHTTQRAVDSFVDQASDSLRALRESLDDCIRELAGARDAGKGLAPGLSSAERLPW